MDLGNASLSIEAVNTYGRGGVAAPHRIPILKVSTITPHLRAKINKFAQ